MKNFNQRFILLALYSMSSFLNASQPPINNSFSRPPSIQRSSPSPSPREPGAHTPKKVGLCRPPRIDLPQQSNASPSTMFERPEDDNGLNNDPSAQHHSIVMSPADLHNLIMSHSTQPTAPTCVLPPITPHVPPAWIEHVESVVMAGAVVEGGILTYRLGSRFFQPATRMFVPGMDTAAIGALHIAYTAASSATWLIALTALVYKVNRIIHAPCRAKLASQNRDFADQVAEFTGRVDTYQANTDQTLQMIAQRVNLIENYQRRLAGQTQEGFGLQTQQINALRAATTSSYGLLQYLVPVMQAQATSNQSTAQQLPAILAQAQQTNDQLQQMGPEAAPQIDAVPTDQALVVTTTAPIQPPKIKQNSCCCQ